MSTITAATIKAYLAGPQPTPVANTLKTDTSNPLVDAKNVSTQVATGSVPSAINVAPAAVSAKSAVLPAAASVTLSASAKAAVAAPAPTPITAQTAAPAGLPNPYAKFSYSASDVQTITAQITAGNAARALAAKGQKLTLSQYGDAVQADSASKQLAGLRFQLNEAQKAKSTGVSGAISALIAFDRSNGDFSGKIYKFA